MQHCAREAGDVAMYAVLKCVPEVVEQTAKDMSTPEDVVEVANVNSADQVVLSGHRSAVEAACVTLKEQRHCMRSMELAVSAPFHTSIMQPVGVVLRGLLGTTADAMPDTAIGVVESMENENEREECHRLLGELRGTGLLHGELALPVASNLSGCLERDVSWWRQTGIPDQVRRISQWDEISDITLSTSPTSGCWDGPMA